MSRARRMTVPLLLREAVRLIPMTEASAAAAAVHMAACVALSMWSLPFETQVGHCHPSEDQEDEQRDLDLVLHSAPYLWVE